MNRNLLGNFSIKTSSIVVENGYKKQGRGVLSLMILAVFGMFFGGTAWGQATHQYYCMHCDGKGYLKQYKGIIGNDGTFRYDYAHNDNGSSMWVYSDGYLQQEMYYLNVINNKTLVLSTTPVTQWDTIPDGDKQRFQMRGSTKILGLDANKNVVLAENPTNKYAACKLTVTHTNKWEGPKDVSWTVQSPQLVTYLRVYYLRNITVFIDKNDAGTVNVNVVDGKDSRCYCRLTYADTQPGSTDGWNINTTTGIIYNTTTSQKTVAKSYSLEPLDPIVRGEHSATTATVTIKVNAKAFTPVNSKKYLLFNTESNNYRFPKTSSSLSEGDLLPVNGKQSDLTEAINGDIAWEVEVDDEGFYLFRNVGTGRCFYYDAADYTVSDYGAVKLGSTAPGSDTRYKFRLYSGCGNRDPFGSCLYIIPYEKQFAVWKSDGVLGEHYFALYMNTSNSTKIASITKTSEQAKWKIYNYEWEYRLWSDYSINGNHELYAIGNYPYTASTWISQNIIESPANSDYCLLPGSKTHDGITYNWTLTDLNDYISTNATLASGISTLTATVNSLPPGIRRGNFSVTASVTTPDNNNLSNSKSFMVTLYNLNASLTPINSLSDITDENGLYKLTADNTYSNSNKPTVSTFSGILDCDGHIVSGLSAPLFTTLTNGIVRNLNLKDVAISQSGNVGAIACTANGASRIYNCGIRPNNPQYTDTSYVKSVETKGYCGSLVGLLDGTARVINCYSFANVKGGTIVAGIVGYNNTSNATQDNYAEKTIVMNCVFYGEIDTTQCNTKGAYPVYGGNKIQNDGNKAINNYNYYCAASKFDNTYASESRYNCSWPAKVERLRRFEYYRSILNSNRRLCTFWVTDRKVQDQTSTDTALIAKWVLDNSIAPYPILKKWGKYPSVINIDTTRVWDSLQGEWVQRTNAAPYRGKKLGELSVTIKTGAHPGTVGQSVINNESRTLVITDMDTTSYDYCYGKVQLPYYNDLFGNPSSDDYTTRYHGNYTDSVVTGWKITSVTTMNGYNDTVCFEGPWDDDGTRVRYRKKANAWESGFNYADRKCTSKDLYVTTGRVFAQGGYYYVPDSVTAITIEAYWGKAFYLQAKDNSLERVDVAKTKNYGSPFTPAGTLPTSFSYSDGNTNHSIDIYNDFATIMTDIKENKTCNVYDQALVLLSNFPLHAENDLTGSINNNGDKGGVTMMSADFDMDNEPDFCFPFQWREASNYTRWPIMPFRFDFLPIPELGMAMRHNKYAYSIGIFVPNGHFEITETAFIYTTQYEYMSKYDPINHQKPLILNGGQYEQIVCHADAPAVSLDYTSNIIMGGHIWMKRFTPGSHSGKKCYVRHCAVSIMGGEYPEFYLTGLYRSDVDSQHAYNDSPHCYTNGGRFGIMAGAATETAKKDVVFKIDHSIIREFYGGGCNAANPVEGNINVTIDHSLVLNKYCGGPKVGVMKPGKNVVTNATGTHFLGDYFGGGNGGTNLYREQLKDETPDHMPTENEWRTTYGFDAFNPVHGDSPFNEDWGYYAEFEFEVFNQSNGLSNHAVARTYQHWAQFGTTRTGTVTNTLTDCIINGNFYGGGYLGNVGGDELGDKWVNSVLTNDIVYGNVFGAGYSAAIPTFIAHTKVGVSFPRRDAAGVVIPAKIKYQTNPGTQDTIQFKWCYKNPTTNEVIPAGVVIPSTATTSDPTFEYPLGSGRWYCLTTKSLENLGLVSGDVTLIIQGKSTIGTYENGVLKHNTGNVYGGGDESAVSGTTKVFIKDRTKVYGNIYGGGNRGRVGGDTKVIINGEVPTSSGTANQNTNH